MGKQHFIIGALIGLLLLSWLQGVFDGISNFPCHIDIDRWTKATTAVSQGNYYEAVRLDRLPLYLFAGAYGIQHGMLAIDALQLISRLSWALCIVVMYIALSRKTGAFAAIIALLPMLWAHSYAGMTLEVTAQIFFNLLVAVHFWLGFQLARSRHFLAWIGLGFLVSILPITKEQGFLFPICTLFFLLSQSRIKTKGWSDALKRGLAFGIGALPLHIWLWNWVSVMRQVGTKYNELESDLQSLQQANNFSSMTQESLHWGSLDITYQNPNSYMELLFKAWPRLTHEIGTHVLIGLALALLVFAWKKAMRSKGDNSYLLWIIIHIIPAIPLFLMLLIEPYHLSFLEIPAIAFIAWAIRHCLYRESGKLDLLKPKRWPFAGLLCYAIGICLYIGQPFSMAIPGQIGSCIAGRMIPVMHYLHRAVDKETIIYVTDTVIRFNKTLPPRFKAVSSPDQLPKDRCSNPVAVISSPWTKGWRQFNNHLRHPNWRMMRDVRSINNETWYVYQPICQ